MLNDQSPKAGGPSDLELKMAGFLPERQAGYFCLRIKMAGGSLQADKLTAIKEVAEAYGQGRIHLTSRQNVEVPHIARADVEKAKARLAADGLEPCALGPRLRTLTACHGMASCKNGLIDAQGLAAALTKALSGRGILPHKFRIGLSGCSNNCMKAEENELGLKGGLRPQYDGRDCVHCGACVKVCPGQAVSLREETIEHNPALCLNCGKCLNKCPQKCWSGQTGVLLSAGGRMGNEQTLASRLGPLIPLDKIVGVVGKCLDFYEQNGQKGERFKATLSRVGQAELLACLGL
ncbi:MAG: 4Fe-4S binding protein [Candidatus Adiutrix sp.]|jgi:dissimilatory sulfite reductase (desulfoviridin) alpha/beta subunit|nr:4Fe-4S binding protein [Candidatus Adiutrix sp.]